MQAHLLGLAVAVDGHRRARAAAPTAAPTPAPAARLLNAILGACAAVASVLLLILARAVRCATGRGAVLIARRGGHVLPAIERAI